ncbi:hypothetical protein K1719_039326 [Acacia pycnantha]|nr:hypothetical protein K1719_039326 [Acacia pycnantha]
MDKFLHEMEREKPIRFSSHHLILATNNYSNKLGSGGYGLVNKETFSDGTNVAVKVLNGSSDKRIEEQFMNEDVEGPSVNYAALELWMPVPITYKCDVYSFGMLSIEIIGRRKNLDINLTEESKEWFPRWVE